MEAVRAAVTEGRKMEGKCVVITGATSGAGRAMALEFARGGATVVLTARREVTLTEVVGECEAAGGKAIAITADVTDAEALKEVAAAAVAAAGSIDVWVNNAGVLAAGPFDETPVEVHDRVIQINLIGYLHGAHAVIPYFKQQQYGVLINNISVGGWIPTPYAVGYAASKFGLKGFSESLKSELSAWPDIHVCDIFPAFLDTPGIQHAANYTGSYLKPAPPVYDPQRVARTVYNLALHPKPGVAVGSVAVILKTFYNLLPGIYRRVTEGVIRTYIKQATPQPHTSGNLFEAVEYGTSIHGGWNSQADREKREKTATLLLAGLAAGYLLLKGLRK